MRTCDLQGRREREHMERDECGVGEVTLTPRVANVCIEVALNHVRGGVHEHRLEDGGGGVC